MEGGGGRGGENFRGGRWIIGGRDGRMIFVVAADCIAAPSGFGTLTLCSPLKPRNSCSCPSRPKAASSCIEGDGATDLVPHWMPCFRF